MTPFSKDINIRRGDTKSVFFRVRTTVYDPVTNAYVPDAYRVLTGWSVLSQVRATKDDVGAPLLQFTATLADQVAVPGGVYLELTPVQTGAVSLALITGVWDVQLTDPGGKVYTYIDGKVTFDKDVSR